MKMIDLEKQMTERVELDLTSEQYHSITTAGVSKSDLDLIHRSPLHYLTAKNSPKETTPALTFGELVHTVILQPELVSLNYAVSPACDKRTKEGKLIWENFVESSIGKTIVSAEDMETAQNMRRTVMSSKTASALINSKCLIESSGFSIDEDFNVMRKCRPDIAIPSRGVICDLKTTLDASINEFRRSIVNYKYDKQAAYYLDTYSKASGIKYDSFIFICVEKKDPYCVAVYLVNDAVVEAGRQLYKKDLKRYYDAFCGSLNDAKNFGYPDEIQIIDMANYGFDIESR